MFSFLKGVSKVSVAAVVGFGAAILGAFLGWVLFPTLIAINIDKQTVIEEGTEQYERWIDVPQPLNFKVYIFNVTNPKEVLDGAIPNVAEIGPYIYRQYRHKVVTEISPDKKNIAYRGVQTFFFDEKASSPLTENDHLTVLNAQLNSVIQIVESLTPPLLRIVNSNLKNVFGEKYTSMFMHTKPSELLFTGIPLCGGKQSSLSKIICLAIKKLRPKAILVDKDGNMRFSMFGFKNNTDDGLFDMYTGIGQVNKLGLIRTLDNRPHLDVWRKNKDAGLSVCNMINGTDTTIFPPRVPTDFLYIFSTDICRSVKVYFTEEVEFNGIPAYRYQVGDEFIRDIGPEYGNDCFCMDRIEHIPKQPNGCLHKGALDLSTCQVKIQNLKNGKNILVNVLAFAWIWLVTIYLYEL